MPMRTPSASKTKPTGSAASWGMVNGVTAMSPIENPLPAAKYSTPGKAQGSASFDDEPFAVLPSLFAVHLKVLPLYSLLRTYGVPAGNIEICFFGLNRVLNGRVNRRRVHGVNRSFHLLPARQILLSAGQATPHRSSAYAASSNASRPDAWLP